MDVDEIAIKLGVKTGDFKAALADANAQVKSFGQGGRTEAGAFTEALHETHKAVRQLHQLFLAGGIVEVVKSFFEAAIKYAETTTDKTDENAAAVRRFSETLKESGNAAGHVASTVVGFFNRVGEKIGELYLRRNAWVQDLVTGDNEFSESLERNLSIAEQAERTIDAVNTERKKHGTEYLEITKEINAEHEKEKALVAGQLPLELQLANVRADIAKQEAIVNDASADKIVRRRAELALAKDQTAEAKLVADIQKKADADAIADNKLLLDTELQGMTAEQKIAELKREIPQLEADVTEQKKLGKNVSVEQAALDERRAMLVKLVGDEETKSLARKRQIAGSDQEELEFLTLQHKAILGIASGPELDRLKTIKLQRQEREAELQILDILHKAEVGPLSADDEARLQTLIKQKEVLDEQIDAINQLGDVVVPRTTRAFHAITQELQNQLDLMNSLSNHLDQISQSMTDFGGVGIGNPRSVDELSNLSDAALQALIKQNADKVAQLEAGKFGASAGAEAASNYLFRSIAEGQIELDTQNAKKVLQLRQAVTGKDTSSAISAFTAAGGSITQFDQYVSQAQGSNAVAAGVGKVNQTLTQIGQTLNGVFFSGGGG